ncbi:MAG TPA: response regulator, partial [Candidatus Limnocylindrales bacterium]|nr:response regulator [Candidatus Limnocylindrales bacterium]
MPASRILLFDSDAAAGEAIRTSLSARGYSVTLTGDADEAFAQAPEHQLAIIDIASGPRSAVDVCREIRATPALASVPVMCVSATDDVEERILFLEAGADDVMARPFDARELEARVEALLLRFQRSKGLPPVVSADGLTLSRARRTVAVFSPKGGAGTTTVATNIAIAAVARRPDRVILVDFALQFGGVATLLDLDPKQTLADVVRDEAFVREPEQLRTFAMRHDSGLHVLASPAVPEAAETITSAHVEGILATLLDGYDMIVVDAGSTLDERVLT